MPHDDVKQEPRGPAGLGGWLLVLCLLLLVWQPISLGLIASSTLDALFTRGLPLAVVLTARVLVTAFGITAGVALVAVRPWAVAAVKASLALSAVVDVFVYTTSYFPSRRLPGQTPIFVAASLTYYAVWLVYLSRSKRVRNTF